MADVFTLLKAVLDERDLRYKERFDAGDKALQVALATSDKALDRADKQLSEYKIQSNEWRGQVRDIAATQITRSEVQSSLKSQDDKIDAQRTNLEKQISAITTDQRGTRRWGVETIMAAIALLISFVSVAALIALRK